MSTPYTYAHLRSAFRKKVDEYIAEEKKELDLRDQAIARTILESDTRWDEEDSAEEFPMRMTVYIYGR